MTVHAIKKRPAAETASDPLRDALRLALEREAEARRKVAKLDAIERAAAAIVRLERAARLSLVQRCRHAAGCRRDQCQPFRSTERGAVAEGVN
jgi:hypothetical protein